MSYAANDVKKDPDTGIIAVKTGMTDPEKAWQIVMVSDGTSHYATDVDVDSWTDGVFTA